MLVVLSLQRETFLSSGYKNFIEKDNKGLDILMQTRDLKGECITYDFNNEKIRTLTAQHKSKRDILEAVDNVRITINNWRKGTAAIANNNMQDIENKLTEKTSDINKKKSFVQQVNE